jgi:prepilin-type N-terminal cleavage/methylation domain-containing protein
MKFLKSTSGFTIIELMIAMTIFAIMSTMVITIYFSITGTTRKLNAQRELSESAREVIERITEDVREYGFSGSEAFDLTHTPWTTYDPLDGSEYLNLKNGTYVYGKKTLVGIDPCLLDDKNNPKTHCGLYFRSSTSDPSDFT